MEGTDKAGPEAGNIADGSNPAAGAGFCWGVNYMICFQKQSRRCEQIFPLCGRWVVLCTPPYIHQVPLFSPFQRVFQRSRHICTDPCCSSVPSQALLSFPWGCGAPNAVWPVLFVEKRTCELLFKGDGHSLFFFELCCFCTWLEFAHFFSMHIFIFAHVVPMQNDKTGACECVYYIFYRFCVCVHAKRAACSVDRLLSRLCIWAGLNPIFVSRKAHTHKHTHQCGWSFLWFYRLIFFCSFFHAIIYSHHKSSTDSGNPWLTSVV